jgi:uncharacterized C2H2 Zn-finger protein
MGKMTEEKDGLRCPKCGMVVKEYRNPSPTVEIITPKGCEYLYRNKIVPLWLKDKTPSRCK